MRSDAALVCRVELALPGEPEHLVAGLRRNASLSLYFGSDPVYQFDAAGRLRRAFVDGKLYRSQGDTLAELVRQRTSNASHLLRNDLDEETLEQFRETMQARLEQLLETLDAGDAQQVQAVPEETPLAVTLAGKIEQILDTDPWLARQIAFRD